MRLDEYGRKEGNPHDPALGTNARFMPDTRVNKGGRPKLRYPRKYHQVNTALRKPELEALDRMRGNISRAEFMVQLLQDEIAREER